jgi:hypothetical membrane protein
MAGIKTRPAVWYGVLLFVLVIVVAGILTPGYSHLNQALSELGAHDAPLDWLVRWVGFVPLGASFIVYAFQSRKSFSNDLPFYLFLLTGIAIIVAGIFPTDPRGRRDTSAGMIHAIAGISLLCLLSLTPLVMSFKGLYRNAARRWLLVFSLLMGLLVTTFFVMLPNGISPQLIALHQKILGDYFEVWYPLHGLHQRLLLALYFVWLIIFSQSIPRPTQI